MSATNLSEAQFNKLLRECCLDYGSRLKAGDAVFIDGKQYFITQADVVHLEPIEDKPSSGRPTPIKGFWKQLRKYRKPNR